MRLSTLASLTTLLALLSAGASAARAQGAELFQPPRAVLAPPATIASIAEGFNLSAAPLPTRTFHRPQVSVASAPVPVEDDQDVEAHRKAEQAMIASAAAPVPLPPRPVREASLKPVAVSTGEQQADAVPTNGPKPVVTAAAGPAAIAKVQQLSNSDIVDRANAYFTGLSTLVADFMQVGGDGRRLGGTLYLQRPGKIRFEFDPPATLEVIADGTSVAVRDKKLQTQDIYFIQQTPLKFLLREKVNLGGDIKITGISSEANSTRINLEDSSTLGGTSRITLYFDPEIQNLTQWRIVDPQGFQTVVTLNKTDRARRIDQNLFRIPNAPTIPGTGGNR